MGFAQSLCPFVVWVSSSINNRGLDRIYNLNESCCGREFLVHQDLMKLDILMLNPRFSLCEPRVRHEEN